jgi:hypothetical protein
MQYCEHDWKPSRDYLATKCHILRVPGERQTLKRHLRILSIINEGLSNLYEDLNLTAEILSTSGTERGDNALNKGVSNFKQTFAAAC